jgi:hypothetical protein
VPGYRRFYQDEAQLQAEMQDGTAATAIEPVLCPPITQAARPGAADDRLALIHLPGANLWKPLSILQRLGWYLVIPWTVIPEMVVAGAGLPGGLAFLGAGGHAEAFTSLRGLVPDGAAIFGQIPHSDIATATLAGTRKVLIVGELRGHLIACLQRELHEEMSTPARAARTAGGAARTSRQEQMCAFLRDRGPALFSELLAVLTWATEPDILILRHEALPSPVATLDGHLLAALRPLNRENDEAADDRSLSIVPAPPGPSDHPSSPASTFVSLAEIWSDEAEKLFTAFGGCYLNQALGYDQPYPAAGHAGP